MRIPIPSLLCLCVLSALTCGLSPETQLHAQAADNPPWPHGIRLAVGRADSGVVITAWADSAAFDLKRDGILLAIVGPADQLSPDDANSLRTSLAEVIEKPVHLFVIPTTEADSYPPQGTGYNTDGARTATVVWRTLGWIGPDVVVEVIDEADESAQTGSLETSLATAAKSRPVAGIASVPSVRLSAAALAGSKLTREALAPLMKALPASGTSPLHQELLARRNRSADQVCWQLLDHYGRELRTVMYQPALAVIARRTFYEQRDDSDTANQHIAKVLEPYLSGRQAAADRSKPVNGSVLAGHLVFADWYLAIRDQRALALIKSAADAGFDEQGRMREAVPSHNEMSDAVFMACPILTAAGRFTGDPKYLQMAARHLDFMEKLCLRTDGLYRHSPLCEAAWGRGNGFPILGLTLCLTDLEAIENDDDAPESLKTIAAQLKERMQADLQRHAQALARHQDVTGMWRQVIDEPSAYREMTSTCMIGFSLQRAISRGWLDKTRFTTIVDRAWQAVSPRIAPDGTLLDVCTGTGKQKSLQDYFDRTAINGRDERGGAMALLFATERAKAER